MCGFLSPAVSVIVRFALRPVTPDATAASSTEPLSAGAAVAVCSVYIFAPITSIATVMSISP